MDPVKEPPKTELQQAPVSNLLSGSDSTKEQRSKLRGAPLKESGAPVFREAYYSQLREVHGANMRAVEAAEAHEEDPTGRRRRRAVDPDSVNDLMEDVIREIAAGGELVTKEKVNWAVQCQCSTCPFPVYISVAIILPVMLNSGNAIIMAIPALVRSVF